MIEEAYETTEEYKEEIAKLFELIQRRDDMRALLKIAKPPRIPEIRQVIANLDGLIEDTEEIMEMIAKKHRLELEAEKNYEELNATYEAIKPELLAYLAEHNPEAYEKLKAELEELEAKEAEETD